MTRLRSLTGPVQVIPLDDTTRQKLSKALQLIQWALVTAITLATLTL